MEFKYLFMDIKEACKGLEELPEEEVSSDQIDAEYLKGYIAQCRKRLDVLLKRRDKLRFLGTSENTKTWKSNAYDIAYTLDEIEHSNAELKAITKG